jgi:hypothetical protein
MVRFWPIVFLGCSASTPDPFAGKDGGFIQPDGAVVASAWGKDQCPAPTGDPIGFAAFNQIGQLPIVDCDTNAPATIDDVCGASATWIFVAHTHCPTCQGTASFTPEIAKSVASSNIAIVHIVHDDNGTSCAVWRDRYKLAGIPNVKVFADPKAEAWAAIKRSNVTAPSLILDRNRIVTYGAQGMSSSQIKQQLDIALMR